MGTISRVKDFVDGEVLTADDLDSEFNRIHNLVNGNLDTANLLDDGVDLSQVAQAGSLDVTSVFADNVVTASKIASIPANSVSTSQVDFGDDTDLEFGEEPDFAVRYDPSNDRWEIHDLINARDLLYATKNGGIQLPNGFVGDLDAEGGETIWDESETHIPRGRIQALQSAQIDSNAVGNDEVASNAVHRAELKTATGSSSSNINGGRANISLNAYSHFPGIEADNDDVSLRAISGDASVGPDDAKFRVDDEGNAASIEVAWRYHQSSPPYDLGDGVAGVFIYLKMDENGDVTHSWVSQDPPWANRHTETIPGKGLCYVEKNGHDSILQAARNGGVNYTPVKEDKNRYMDHYPHPFDAKDNVILLDPVSDISRELFNINDSMNLDPDEPNVSKLITKGYIEVTDDLTEKRCGPDGVDIYGCRWS